MASFCPGTSCHRIQQNGSNGSYERRHAQDLALPEHEDLERELGHQTSQCTLFHLQSSYKLHFNGNSCLSKMSADMVSLLLSEQTKADI